MEDFEALSRPAGSSLLILPKYPEYILPMQTETGNRLWNTNFTLLWLGQFVSSLGKQAYSLTAMLWIKQATGSGSLMGLVMTAALLPSLVVGPLAGVFVDRLDRKKLIAWTDIAGGVGVLTAAIVFFAFPGHTSVLLFALFFVSILTGILDTVSQPSIGASIPDLVPSERIEAANGFNMSGIQIAAFSAQGFAGLLFRLIGAPFLVLLNALTYLTAGIGELFIKIPKTARPQAQEMHPWRSFKADLAEGFRFIVGNKKLFSGVIVFAAINFFITPVLVTLPFFAEDFLSLGAEWYGYFMGIFGIGGLAGYIIAGGFPVRGKKRTLIVAAGSIIQSALVLMVILFKHPGLQLLFWFANGLLNGVINVNIISLMQIIPPAELRGRVQGFTTTIVVGIMPLGMALSGFLFDLIGQNVMVMFGVSGGLLLAVSILCLLSRNYRDFLSYITPANRVSEKRDNESPIHEGGK